MTKYIPPQERVTGTFPVIINGSATFLKVGSSFVDTTSLLSALDGANILYADPPLDATTGVTTGRIRIPGTGGSLFISQNGVTGTLPVNQWFTPYTGHLEIIQAAAIVYEVEYTTSPANPNMFTNGSLDSGSTGWNFNSEFISFAGGQAIIWDQFTDASGSGSPVLYQTLADVAGGTQYDITVDIASRTAGTIYFYLGGANVTGPNSTGRTTAGTWSFTATAGNFSKICGLAISPNAHFAINSVTMTAH